MLEKQKAWIGQKMRKAENFIERNKGAIGFGMGLATMAGLYLIAEKLDAPKSGAITYTRYLEDDKPNILAGIYYKNRFGKEKNPLSIRYDYDNANLKALCDNLNEIVYPGD